MSNMKSKLAASVRQVKAQAPAPAPAKSRVPARPTPAKKPPAKAQQSLAPTTTVGQPQASGSALFPSRVWPD